MSDSLLLYPSLQLPRESSATEPFLHLPKIIFQTWETNQLDPEMYEAAMSWGRFNPDWEVRFYDATGRRDFIKEHFDEEVLYAYDNLIPGAFQADLWRYCVLYVHGGVYADINKILRMPFAEAFPREVDFVSISAPPIHGYRCILNNPFLAAKPHHPFIKQIIEHITLWAKSGFYGRQTLAITGPLALGFSVNRVLGRADDTPLLPGEYHINQYRFLLLTQSENPTILYPKKIYTICSSHSENKAFMDTGYPSSRFKYAPTSIDSIDVLDYLRRDYSLAWRNNRVYRHGKVTDKKNAKVTSDRQLLKICVRRLINQSYLQGQSQQARHLFAQALSRNLATMKMLETVLRHEWKKVCHRFVTKKR